MYVQTARIQQLNQRTIQPGQYVLYWMQQAQRAEENHALEFAIEQANELGQSVLVGFGLMGNYPEANWRHYTFMLQGLGETQATLAQRGIPLIARYGSPEEVALELGQQASLIVCDGGYLRHQRAWRQAVAAQARCRVVQVESDVVVPVAAASQKAEYAARTLRPKLRKLWAAYLRDVPRIPLQHPAPSFSGECLDLSDIDAVLTRLRLDRSIPTVSQFFRGGTSQAKLRFQEFLSGRLSRYAQHSNQPQTNDISHMSPYLHFGQISPLYLAQQVQKENLSFQDAHEAYLEQLLVRRELAMNFVFYTADYDSFRCLPAWARATLDAHRQDRRKYRYTLEELTRAQTHDPYWNAAMLEMKTTGFMHNYMRMYWGKKILEWSESPEQAFSWTLALNNTYFLDGRDPNSYAGVAWLFGVHDRAWQERPIFGKIRYMAASGLKRKCDIDAYIRKVQQCMTRSSSSVERRDGL